MKKIIIISAILCMGIIAKAQTNFSGAWSEPQLEMIEGKQYSNAVPVKITVTQTKDSIKIERTEAGADATPSTQTLALNGKTFERLGKTSKRTIRTTATWSADKKILTIITIYSYAEKPTEAEYTNTEVWELENDKLVITKLSDAAVTDDWKIKAVYSK